MDRRVLLVAEPGPLVSSSGGELHAGDSAAAAGSIGKVRRDLEHLAAVIDMLSAYCGTQKQEKQEKEGEYEEEEEDAVENDISRAGNGTIPGTGTPALPSRNQQATAAAAPTSSSNSPSQGGRRVLLAAAFPCPALLPESKQVSRRLAVAAAFADALDGCGVWLSPADFEARVLVPARTLVSLQLEELDDGREDPAAGSATSAAEGVAPAAACAGGGGDMCCAKRPRSPLLSCDDRTKACARAGDGPAAAESAEAFVRSAAEEITLLVDTAVAEGQEREATEESEGGGSELRRRRLCMFDVLWAAASLPAGGEGWAWLPVCHVCGVSGGTCEGHVIPRVARARSPSIIWYYWQRMASLSAEIKNPCALSVFLIIGTKQMLPPLLVHTPPE